MRLTSLFNESPYLNPGEMRPTVTLAGDYSQAALAREFSQIGEIVVPGEEKLVVLFRPANAIVVRHWPATYAGRILPIMNLHFKAQVKLTVVPREIAHLKSLQVNAVGVDLDSRTIGIASQIYELLIQKGYAIISDFTQFDPAQGLWKKLARNPENTVIVSDTDHGPFKDQEGGVINYNGTNISDHDIWTQGSDFSGFNRVLILFK